MKVSEMLKSLYGDNFIMPDGMEDKEVTGYIPKSRFDEVNNAKKILEENSKKYEEQLKNLENVQGDITKYKEEIAKINTEKQNFQKEYENKMKEMKINAEIEKALLTSKAKNDYAEFLKGKIDITKIVEDNGKYVNLTEQIENLKKTQPLFFEDVKIVGGTPNSGTPSITGDIFGENGKQMTDTDWIKAYEEKITKK